MMARSDTAKTQTEHYEELVAKGCDYEAACLEGLNDRQKAIVDFPHQRVLPTDRCTCKTCTERGLTENSSVPTGHFAGAPFPDCDCITCTERRERTGK